MYNQRETVQTMYSFSASDHYCERFIPLFLLCTVWKSLANWVDMNLKCPWTHRGGRHFKLTDSVTVTSARCCWKEYPHLSPNDFWDRLLRPLRPWRGVKLWLPKDNSNVHEGVKSFALEMIGKFVAIESRIISIIIHQCQPWLYSVRPFI